MPACSDAFLQPRPTKNLSLRSGPIPTKRKTSPIETRIIRPFPSPATCSGLFLRLKQWNPTHRPWPETHMPPGLNREQTSAWALDNFPALGGHSCQFCRDGTTVQAGCCVLLAAGTETVPELRRVRNAVETHVSRSQWLKLRRSDSHPKTRRMLQTAQPGDASTRGGRQRHGHIAAGSPRQPPKLLKTQA